MINLVNEMRRGRGQEGFGEVSLQRVNNDEIRYLRRETGGWGEAWEVSEELWRFRGEECVEDLRRWEKRSVKIVNARVCVDFVER